MVHRVAFLDRACSRPGSPRRPSHAPGSAPGRTGCPGTRSSRRWRRVGQAGMRVMPSRRTPPCRLPEAWRRISGRSIRCLISSSWISDVLIDMSVPTLRYLIVQRVGRAATRGPMEAPRRSTRPRSEPSNTRSPWRTTAPPMSEGSSIALMRTMLELQQRRDQLRLTAPAVSGSAEVTVTGVLSSAAAARRTCAAISAVQRRRSAFVGSAGGEARTFSLPAALEIVGPAGLRFPPLLSVTCGLPS